MSNSLIVLIVIRRDPPELVAAGSSVILTCSYRVTEGEDIDSIKWWDAAGSGAGEYMDLN